MKFDTAIGLSEYFRTGSDVFVAFQQIVHELGGKGFLYLTHPLPSEQIGRSVSRTALIAKSFPDAYDDPFALEGFLDNDTPQRLIQQGSEVILWSDIYQGSSAPETESRYTAISNGLRYGATIRLGGKPDGLPRSILHYWHSGSNRPCDFVRIWNDIGPILRRTARFLDALVYEDRANDLVKMTERELECLTAFATGMRAAEICHHFGIKDKTLEKTVSTLRTKLKAQTRDHAVARALRLNLINP